MDGLRVINVHGEFQCNLVGHFGPKKNWKLEKAMARSVMARCIAMAAAVVALFALPSAFVPARQGAPAVSPAVAAGVAAGSMALPAWAYDMADAQILLARVPGGKRTKELGLVVPIPEEDGLTDGQIAALFVVALVGLIAAVDLGQDLVLRHQPNQVQDCQGQGFHHSLHEAPH